MLVSSSSSALTGPGFFLAGIPAAAGCGDEADVDEAGVAQGRVLDAKDEDKAVQDGGAANGCSDSARPSFAGMVRLAPRAGTAA